MKYDYYSSWSKYAFEPEVKRFMNEDEMIDEICVCIDPKTKNRCGGILPLIYRDEKIYSIPDSHTIVEGQTGNKKSRCVVRNAIVASVLNNNSIIVTDVKGELSNDPKIYGLLRAAKYNVDVLDFRTFDKSGYNILYRAYKLFKEKKREEAMALVTRFASSLVEGKKTVDDFWNDMSQSFIVNIIHIMFLSLVQKEDGDKYANIASLISYLSPNQENMSKMMNKLATEFPKSNAVNPYMNLKKIYDLPERTYGCVMGTAMSLLNDVSTRESMCKMLSESTFDICDFYKKKSALFIILPDETNAYNAISSIILDSTYNLLVDEYTKVYQGKISPRCKIHFILEEFGNVGINDISAKVSAARSREINFMLIFQSMSQLKKKNEIDMENIYANCRNFLFLGSSQYKTLKNVSDTCGTTCITRSGGMESIVPVEALRKMRKEWEYKDALFMRDDMIFCAKLVDYDQYKFLERYKNSLVYYKTNIFSNVKVYTPEMLYADYLSNYKLVNVTGEEIPW